MFLVEVWVILLHCWNSYKGNGGCRRRKPRWLVIQQQRPHWWATGWLPPFTLSKRLLNLLSASLPFSAYQASTNSGSCPRPPWPPHPPPYLSPPWTPTCPPWPPPPTLRFLSSRPRQQKRLTVRPVFPVTWVFKILISNPIQHHVNISWSPCQSS